MEPLGLQDVGGLRCPLLVDCNDPRTLFAGTVAAGVVRSRDGGKSWQKTSNGLTKPEIWWLEQHPRTGELWAGTSPASMFHSADRGEHWQECDGIQQLPRVPEWTFPNPPHIAHVKHLSLRADDPADILAAVEEGWLIRSRDGGRTWSNLTEGTEFDSHTAYFRSSLAPAVLGCIAARTAASHLSIRLPAWIGGTWRILLCIRIGHAWCSPRPRRCRRRAGRDLRGRNRRCIAARTRARRGAA